jgi:hypothetical protein
VKLRVLVSLVIAFVALSVLADPYTFHLNGSDAVVPAPLGQTIRALLDVALLVAAWILLFRGGGRIALTILLCEFPYALAVNAVLIHRDGIGRFFWGFGAESHVLDFAIAFGLRALIIVALFWNSAYRSPAA